MFINQKKIFKYQLLINELKQKKKLLTRRNFKSYDLINKKHYFCNHLD